MAKHVRSGDAYGDGMFYFTQPVGAGGGYGDGMFYFTQPVGAGGAYGDGGFFFTQPVGAPSGYGDPGMRRGGFRHPSARRGGYGVVPAAGLGGRLGGGTGGRFGQRKPGLLAAAGAGSLITFKGGGAGSQITKAELDEIEKLARSLGKSEYWYALRTSYLNPSKRTVESFPVINAAGSSAGDMKPRDKSKLSERSKNEIAQEQSRVASAQSALDAKLGLVLSRPLTTAQANALAEYVKQGRRNGAFAEIFRNNPKYRSYPNSPALYKLMIMDAGLKYAKGERTKDNAVGVVRDYARLSPMSASPTTDFRDEALKGLRGEGYDIPDRSWAIVADGYTQDSFPAELNNLRGSLTTARAYADEALKAARAEVEKAPAQAAQAGQAAQAAQPAYTPSGADEPADTMGPVVSPAAPPMQPIGTSEEPAGQIIIADETATEKKGQESFFVKYQTQLLVGGALAALFLFRKQLGIGGDAVKAKE